MVTIRPKKIVEMGVTGKALSHSKTAVQVRDLNVIIDEPTERGGTNEGPAPVETVLAALAACTNRIGHKCAEKNDVDIRSMDIDVVVVFDRRGADMELEVDVPFREIRMTIDLETTAPDDAVEAMKTDLAKFCPVSKLIRQAGTKITEEWRVTRPAEAGA